ncbi:hypothetical protein KSP39_PZI021341 [Platanthera zijinensis]|uniref:CCHC-type domain-containing protein n=1 Tax=Platanthera zijinensis TaxID=2320716 RepID=A0AAP0FVS7_9ASPA
MDKAKDFAKLPLCTKTNFPMWKERIKFFMEAVDPRIFMIVEEGPYVPMTTSTIDPTLKVPKKLMDLDKDEIALVSLDKKAKNIIASAVDDSMLLNLIHCQSAKEMWQCLLVLMEGTEEVRDDRRSLLNQKYEAFRQGPKDSITDTFENFSKIVNGLKGYGRKFTNGDLNDKFLRSLTKEWDTKVCAIREFGRLAETDPQNLFGKLMSYEMQINTRKAEEEKSRSSSKDKTVALKAESTKKVKAQSSTPAQEIIESEESSEPSSSGSELSEGEFSLLSRQFKKFLNKKKNWRGKDASHRRSHYESDRRKKGSSSHDRYVPKQNKHVSSDIVCYCCNKPGHMIAECPHKKREGGKKESKKPFHQKKNERSFVAKKTKTLSDSDSSESSEEEEAYFGLMAQTDEETEPQYTGKVNSHTPLSESESSEHENEDSSSDDESELMVQYRELIKAYDKCRKVVKAQAKEIKSLKASESSLREEVLEMESLKGKLNSAIKELNETLSLVSLKEKVIEKLEEQFEAEKKLVESFSKPKTVLPLIAEFSAQTDGAGLGHVTSSSKTSRRNKTQRKNKAAKKALAKEKGKAPQEQTTFNKVIYPTNKFDLESSYGHWSRPTYVEPKSRYQGWARPRNFGESVFKAPYEKISLQSYGPYNHGHNFKRAPKVKEVEVLSTKERKACSCHQHEASTSRAAPPARPHVKMVKQEKNGQRYNRFHCWCCGKIEAFAAIVLVWESFQTLLYDVDKEYFAYTDWI